MDGDTIYADYVAAHSSEWTNIMTNLGFYWADASGAAAEPDWDNLDWSTHTARASLPVPLKLPKRGWLVICI